MTTPKKATLEEKCYTDLQALKEYSKEASEEEKALYERIEEIEDPLKWEEKEADAQVAEQLWKTMLEQQNQKIQSAAICASLRGLRAVAALPAGGYI